jgi:tetrapyrrole methylase family protein / MazG family protein
MVTSRGFLVSWKDKRMTKNAPGAGIVLVGLGPGDPAQLTREAWDWLQQVGEVYVRTRQHPTVAGFPQGLQVFSFDDLYEQAERFEDVYARIIAAILELGQRAEGVTYAVPGHPFVAEATCPEIARRAKEAGIPLRVIEGLSFLEPTFSALGVDPFPRMVMTDALELAAMHTPPFPPDHPALVGQIYSRQAHRARWWKTWPCMRSTAANILAC